MSFQDQWAEAVEKADEGFEQNDPPDPGIYDVSIQDARAFTSKAGKDTIVIELRVTSGPTVGHEWPILLGFGSTNAAKVAANQCSRLGVDIKAVSTLDELDTALKTHIGTYHQAEVKQNGEYRNTWLQGRVEGVQSDLGTDGSEFATTSAGAADDDDTPF